MIDYVYGIAVGDDGSVVVAGGTWGNVCVVNQGGPDMAAFKLDADGTLLWKWQVTNPSGRGFDESSLYGVRHALRS